MWVGSSTPAVVSEMCVDAYLSLNRLESRFANCFSISAGRMIDSVIFPFFLGRWICTSALAVWRYETFFLGLAIVS